MTSREPRAPGAARPSLFKDSTSRKSWKKERSLSEACDEEDPDFRGYPVTDGDIVRLVRSREPSARLQVLFRPEGEDEQVPEPVLMIDSGGVLGDQSLNRAGSEEILRRSL